MRRKRKKQYLVHWVSIEEQAHGNTYIDFSRHPSREMIQQAEIILSEDLGSKLYIASFTEVSLV